LKIENYHCIKSLELPSGWVEVKSNAEFAPRSIRTFAPASETKVKIGLLNEGVPVGKAATEAFRKLIGSGQRIVFDDTKQKKPSAADQQLMGKAAPAFGNIGNNQIVNEMTGPCGPVFNLERVEVLVWNGRPVLAIRGWFCNPESGTRINAYCGFLVDLNAGETECQIEQIYIEASTENLYLQYLPAFEQSMRSIQWIS